MTPELNSSRFILNSFSDRALAGFSDVLTFGGTEFIRDYFLLNDRIDTGSYAYFGGEFTGLIYTIALIEALGPLSLPVPSLSAVPIISGGGTMILVPALEFSPILVPGLVIGVGLNIIQVAQMNFPEKAGDQGHVPEPTVLQTGGHTLSDRVVKKLGLTKEEAKKAMEGLKRDGLQKANNHQHKILDNGDVLDSNTGQLIGNLFDYIR